MRWLKRIAIALSIMVLLLAAGIGIFLYRELAPFRTIAHSWMFREKQVGPVIGDLGGIPVSMSNQVARFVEYEGDPHFLEPRKGPRPVRTYQSKLRSFGFEVRFPDLALLDDPKTREDRRQSNIYTAMWLSVGVGIHNNNNELTLNRFVSAIPPPGKIHSVGRMSPKLPARTWKEEHGYVRLPEPLYGLTVMEITGYDDAKRYQIPGNGSGDANIYYHTGEQGNVDNYIRCSNIKHAAAPCKQYFILAKAKNTMIDVHYRIGFLPKWREIQEAVSRRILSFKVDPEPTKPMPANHP